MTDLNYLGRQINPENLRPEDVVLDVLVLPAEVVSVSLTSDELTCRCPITRQPDFYTIVIELEGLGSPRTIESKSLKLYLQSFQTVEEGIFAEGLAALISRRISVDTGCPTKVKLTQKSRGGISITTVAVAPVEDRSPNGGRA